MSPLWENVVKPLWGFPRVSGDEPLGLEDGGGGFEFSPRERG